MMRSSSVPKSKTPVRPTRVSDRPTYTELVQVTLVSADRYGAARRYTAMLLRPNGQYASVATWNDAMAADLTAAQVRGCPIEVRWREHPKYHDADVVMVSWGTR